MTHVRCSENYALDMYENMKVINKKYLSWITSHIQVITSVNQIGQGEEKRLKQ